MSRFVKNSLLVSKEKGKEAKFGAELPPHGLRSGNYCYIPEHDFYAIRTYHTSYACVRALTPKTGEPTKFMIVGDNLLELQVARPQRTERASFFIDQSVQEKGEVHMASRVDPLFLLLPVLLKHARKWCPLDQALAEAGCGSLRRLKHMDAQKLCDVNGAFRCTGGGKEGGGECWSSDMLEVFSVASILLSGLRIQN